MEPENEARQAYIPARSKVLRGSFRRPEPGGTLPPRVGRRRGDWHRGAAGP